MRETQPGPTTRRAARATIACGVAALAACAAFGVHRASDDLALTGADGRAGGPPRAMRLLVTGGTEGFLAPCDCQMAQYGGLARRAAYVRAIRRPGDVCIDLGNLLAPDGPSPRLTMDAALDALRTLGCDAFVPARTEILLGEEFEASAASRAPLPVVCANLLRTDSGGPAFPSWIVRTLPDGRSVAVIGVAEPFEGVPSRFRIAPMEESVRAAIAQIGASADAVIVAGGVSDETALALAAKFPSVTLVVGGNSAEGSKRVMKTAGAPVMLVGDFAWHVGRVEFDERLRVADSWLAWLDPRVPDDAESAGIVARWRASVSEENADFADKLVAQLRDQGFTGSAACAECHAEEYATWKSSGHSHAMQTLAGKGADRDPSCIACHLHDVPRDASAALVPQSLGLGCEGCHGAGARHADLARRHREIAASALAPATREACVRCHVPPNVTHFDFEHDWPKIAHGRSSGRPHATEHR